MTANNRSNYERTKNEMAPEFLRHDQAEMIRRFSLAHNDAFLFLTFLGRRCRIDRSTGAVCWSDDGFRTVHDADFNVVMTIYDVLCNAKPGCRLSGDWVSTAGLSTVQGGSLQKSGDFFQNAAAELGGDLDRFCRACEALGGQPVPEGDAAYELALLPFLPVRLRFWAADEDFPASLQIFVDRNTLDYMHYETLMFAVSHLLERLKQAA